MKAEPVKQTKAAYAKPLPPKDQLKRAAALLPDDFEEDEDDEPGYRGPAVRSVKAAPITLQYDLERLRVAIADLGDEITDLAKDLLPVMVTPDDAKAEGTGVAKGSQGSPLQHVVRDMRTSVDVLAVRIKEIKSSLRI